MIYITTEDGQLLPAPNMEIHKLKPQMTYQSRLSKSLSARDFSDLLPNTRVPDFMASASSLRSMVPSWLLSKNVKAFSTMSRACVRSGGHASVMHAFVQVLHWVRVDKSMM